MALLENYCQGARGRLKRLLPYGMADTQAEACRRRVMSVDATFAILFGSESFTAYTLTKMSSEERVSFLKILIESTLEKWEEEKLATAIMGLIMVSGDGFKPHLSGYLEELYWRIPSSFPYHRDKAGAAFVAARLCIAKFFIGKWAPEITNESLAVFRLFIAMGWPQLKDQPPQEGETLAEINARGRVVLTAEEKEMLGIFRERTEAATVRDNRSWVISSMYGAWLSLPCVPRQLQQQLLMARARVGGPALALQDVRHGELLQGIPQTALDLLRTDVCQPLQRTVLDVEDLFERTLNWLKEYDSAYLAARYLGREFTFVSLKQIKVTMGPINDFKELAVGVQRIVYAMKDEGRFADLGILLVVKGRDGEDIKTDWPVLV